MISDRDTNTIYFSELLKTDSRFSETSEQIISTLETYGAKIKFLPDTKDIWARDYMPIQINVKKFIEYRYDPDYLQGNWKDTRDIKTYPDIVCESLKLKTEKSDLIMDGGNFVKSSDCIILTDKIVKENRHTYSKTELIKKLHETFEVDKVVLIPWDKLDPYGHSDGMIRFIDNKRVLINHFYINDSILQYRLKQAGLKSEPLDFKKKTNDKLNWAYINFLQTKDLILLPKFDIEEDFEAYQQIETHYPDYKGRIAQVEMTKIVEKEGALNCITWTTKE
ncbi:MAG: agmatine deiminase family protein [Salinivirgaceae bacterium]|nr:agmatine deiminase family protein [Salinivirgaceae bacterium]